MSEPRAAIDKSCRLHEGWLLTPEGGAIHQEEATAVIADVHLGYEWARGEAGDCVPAHSLAETLGRLERLLARAHVRRLIVAGDLVESPRPCARTAADVFRLNAWLSEREIDLTVVLGNHDRSLPWIHSRERRTCSRPLELASARAVSGWTICHGDRPTDGERIVMGHHHPVLRAEGFAAPCFLVGAKLMVLPAFSFNTAGCDVATVKTPKAWREFDLRCVASTGGELLDFGPLVSLASRLGQRSARAL